MKLTSGSISLELDDKDGRILSLRRGKRDFIYACGRPLITVWLLDKEGNYTQACSGTQMRAEKKGDTFVLHYTGMSGLAVDADAAVRAGEDGFFLFGLTLRNRTGLMLESIDYPCVTVPDDLKAKGGDGLLFWPAVEGVVIDDLSIKEACGMKFCKDAYPARGWEGRYPGACQMQFSAYFNSDGCLYFASHDKNCNPKIIDLESVDEGVRLQYRMFPGEPFAEEYTLGWDMVLGCIGGDWYDAAEVYRTWLEGSGLIRLPKFKDNTKLPQWLQQSPVVVMYAVVGEDSTARIRDEIYYPYTKGVPYLDGLAKKFDSPVLALMAHWEGTAPWAPPYMWPPYGDLENFRQMIAEMHEKGHRVGLYCSGTAWTQQSGLREEYSREEQFEREGLARYMEVGPDHKLNYSKIICWPLRNGYDMCPATEFAKKVSVEEACKIVENLDVDYLQFFDQNIGGNTYPCYAEGHGHPPVPGKWMNEEMRDLIERMYKETDRAGGRRILIGCEADAAEPFVNDLFFNDSRHNIGYFVGTPVSAYNYMFHEYFNNFMGNQNTSNTIIDHTKYPNNTYYRLAHGFAQGDFLTVVMKNDGKINRDCCTPWDIEPDLNQEELAAYVGRLNAWRKGCAREALFYGRMVKPRKVHCGRYKEDIKYGGRHDFPSVVTECYQTEDGSRLQLLVNYMEKEQSIQVESGDALLVTDASGASRPVRAENGLISLVLPARSVAALKF